jgi:subtilisin family serine protease
MNSKLQALFALLLVLTIAVTPAAAQRPSVTRSAAPAAVFAESAPGSVTDGVPAAAPVSPRLIVQLASPSLVERNTAARGSQDGGRLDVTSPEAVSYINALKAEQAAFVASVQAALPGASAADYINESGARLPLAVQVVMNAVVIDPGSRGTRAATLAIQSLPGVKAVFSDTPHQPDLWASVPWINAQAAWNVVGGRANGGKGVKVASMDGGIHKDAPMFSGTGFSYPVGWPAGGLGLKANNNGKIIASRAYFRSWDPPAAGEENPWPGVSGTSHGVHTSGIMAGDVVSATYNGLNVGTMSGVAPQAWLMSYRVFYNSVNGIGSFYDAEGIAALEDIARDGADVLNNSWGGGPGSVGGPYDALDTALRNVAGSGVFVSMSNGNAGPNKGTGDHPSTDYINVAASSTNGDLAAGLMNVVAPTPITTTLQNVNYGTASFGPALPLGTVLTYTYAVAGSVTPSNALGCNPFPAGTFTGKAAVISRGTCNFSLKTYNAQVAGAEFVVIANNVEGTIAMAAGVNANLVTISTISVPLSKGQAMKTVYDRAVLAGKAAKLTVNTIPFKVSVRGDVIADFSSRGPGVGNVLKPDIAAPGVDTLSQGYTEGVSGEARHLGFGLASGTSMAAPHVTGAAALVRQAHPTWTNAEIKSALMTTSKYLGVYNANGTPAQPLDMGAGRLDLTHADNPGLILDPPSLSFGAVYTGTQKVIHVSAHSIASAAETYALGTIAVSGSAFSYTTSALSGVSVSPASLTLSAGETKMFTVTLTTAATPRLGDVQGYVELKGAAYNAHMPAWARVQPAASGKVLVLNNDQSPTAGFGNYLTYYTDALTAAGQTYDVWKVESHTAILEAALLSQYKAILYFSGDRFSTAGGALSAADQNKLVEYANAGGKIIVMGQDFASATANLNDSSATFFYTTVLGAAYKQDSVSNGNAPTLPIGPTTTTPLAFQDTSLDVSAPTFAVSTMSGANEVPAVATANQGTARFALDTDTSTLLYDITYQANTQAVVTGMHIHTGAAGVNGPISYTLYSGTPITITAGTSHDWNGAVTLDAASKANLAANKLYVNIHTVAHPGGEGRAQVVANSFGGGAGNQLFIDEIKPENGVNGVVPLLKYPGPYNLEAGTVALAHSEQPTLERPGISYFGRSIYAGFGLEGVNDGAVRGALMTKFFDWLNDAPTGSIADITPQNASNLSEFRATFASSIAGNKVVSYRWDFGDGTPYVTNAPGDPISIQVGHTYQYCGSYTVRVEMLDSYGIHIVVSQPIVAVNCTVKRGFFPWIGK